ncbi:hypothetical protein DFH08DRAFT_815235 [Mycena albidolilacea]|uniref:Uncharacterized protein n=1 Tax=Mycena albidolilacea TaxID=1033008 RepID=A0AAD7EJ03_9AGAR|nr:hypothetical protein DFH08DRAFT_815235 [Mycena albidolilacea]
MKEDDLIVATAVELLLDGELKSVAVKPGGEAISCGSPQLLELSGISNPKILNKLWIDTKVDLPGVKEGTIEHTYIPISFELKNDSIITLNDLSNPVFNAAVLVEYAP